MDLDHHSHQALEGISGVEDATKRQSKYQEFILRAIQDEDIESCKSYVDHGEYCGGDERYWAVPLVPTVVYPICSAVRVCTFGHEQSFDHKFIRMHAFFAQKIAADPLSIVRCQS